MAEQQITNTEPLLCDIDLGEHGTLQLRSIEELEQWLNTENAFWGWLEEATRLDGNTQEAHNFQMHQRNEIAAHLQSIKQDPSKRDELLPSVRKWLQQRYTRQKALPSESPKAQFLATVPDKVAAAHALWVFMGHGPKNVGDIRSFKGTVLAVAYDLGITAFQPIDEAAITSTQRRVASEHEALRVEAGKLGDEFREHAKKIGELHVDQKRLFDETQAKRNTDFEKLTSDAAKELGDIKETYDKKLALQSAVTYLNTKADGHRNMAIGFGIAALVAGGLFVGLAIWIGGAFFADTSVHPAKIAVAVLGATLVFWLLRILVRVFLSNLHLATDIRGRATLVQTYLSLIREGGGLKEDDRGLIVQLLFRPTSDGLVRDDAMPPGLWDFVNRAVAGKG